MNFARRLLLLIVAAVIASAVSAQTFSDVSPNARATAMGGASLAVQGDAYPTFGNAASPLLAIQYKSIQAGFGYTTFAGSAMRQYRMMAFGGYGRVALRHMVSVGGQFLIEPHNPATGLRSGAQRFDLGYGFKASDCVAVAVTGRYRRSYGHSGMAESVGDFDSGGFDVALFGRWPVRAIEGAMFNFGAKISYDSTSATAYDAYAFSPAVGAGLWVPFVDGHTLEPSVELRYGYGKAVQMTSAKVSIEYGLMQLLYFRCGGNVLYLNDSTPIGYGTVGVGVRFFHLQCDVAYSVGRRGTPMHNAVQFSVGLDF